MHPGHSVERGSNGSTASPFRQTEQASGIRTSHLVHDALLYRDPAEYVDVVRRLTEEALEANEAVMVAVPEPRLGVLQVALRGSDGAVAFLDMRHQGRNPARILPVIRAFADEHRGRRVCFIGEPIWPERAPAEIVEGHRHEALVNVGLAGCNAHVACLYDAGGLASSVVAEALRAHPTIVSGGERRVNESFGDPLTLYAAAEHPLTTPPEDTDPISLHEGLFGVRRDVERHVARELAPERVAELVVAVNEAVSNTSRHASGLGEARIWREDGRVVVEVADRGQIADPLVGRRLPDVLEESGRGIWMMHQLCDLVELRSGSDGTTVRLHMSFD